MDASAKFSAVTPTPNRSEPPEFWHLDWKTFEELTCALLEKEPEVRTVDLFNTEGQSQFGIDVVVHRSDTLAIDVASCKCYRTISAAKIKEWAGDFVDHYETYWKSRQVRTFILVVGSAVNASKIYEEIEAQRLRFAEFGVQFEVWQPRTLQEKLRPHPGIVGQYLDSAFINRICGEVPVSAEALATVSSALLGQMANQTAPLLAALSESWDGRLESLKRRLREEPPHEVVLELERIRAESFWPQLAPNVRSKCLRYLASAKLQEGNVSGAASLAEEADAILPAKAPTFRALLLAWRGDHEEALKLLESSTQRDAQEMKVALLLETGLLDDAEKLLNNLPMLEDAHWIEAARLRAYLRLFRGDREGALVEITTAELKAPRWFAIRRAGAVIRYACALSSAVGPEVYAHPTPVAPELIREDDISQGRLKQALATFDALTKERAKSTGVSDAQVWAFACACSLVDGSVDAQNRCTALLQVEPGNPEVLGWALGRGFEFDRERSLDALKAVVAKENRDPSHVLALTWLLSLRGEGESAKALLLANESLFQGAGRRLAYDARLQSLSVDFSDSTVPLTTAPSAEQRLLNELADERGAVSWEAIESAFAEVAVEKPSAPILLGAATRLAAGGRWSFLAAHSEIILAFGTASAIEVAIHAAYNSGAPELAISLIQRYRNAFPRGELPRNVRVIEVHSLAEQGDHPTALRAAESLAVTFGGSRERLLTADIRIGLGDIAGALPIIRAELSSDSLKPTDALRLSRVVAVEDKELAQKLWKAARRQGIPDQLVITAHVQATRLGLEKEASVFTPTIEMLAQTPGSGAIRVTFEEMEAHHAASVQNQTNLWQAYFNGVTPFQVASEFTGIPLAAHYFIGETLTTSEPIHQPLLIRHGARGDKFDTGVPFGEWRLHCDVTSLLLALQLDVLDRLEDSVSAIIVPKTISQQLVTFAEQLEHPQPSRQRISIELDELVLAKRVKVSRVHRQPDEARLQPTSPREMWSVTPTASDPCSDVDAERQITLRKVLDGLRRQGHVDDESYGRAVANLDLHPNDRPAPSPGSTLLFRGDALETLANFCSLKAVLKTYNVYVEPEYAEGCARQRASWASFRQAADVVARLRRHVAAQLASGRYQTVPQSESAGDIAPEPRRAALLGIFELFRHSADANSVVMCDDRHLTGYPSIGTAPLVGIFEVLVALREANKLPDEEFFAALLQLRQAHTMFLPLTSDEVLYHLERAPMFEDAVVETRPLSIIKRYVARVALLESHLKVGDFPKQIRQQPDETPVLLANRRLSIECIAAVWGPRKYSQERCAAMSTWLWSSLRMERQLGEHPNIKANGDAQQLMTALGYCSLITISLQLVSGPASGWREAFTSWLENIVLSNRLNIDAQLNQRINAQLVNLVENLFRFDSKSQPRPYSDEAIAVYLRKFIDGLPETIQEGLLESEEIRGLTGTKRINVVHIGPIEVLRDDFVTGVRKALRFGRSKAKSHQNNRNVVFESDVETGVIHVRQGGKKFRIFDDLFPLLTLDEPNEIRELLSRHKLAFDSSRKERERLLQAVLDCVSPEARFEKVEQLRASTLVALYKDVEECLKGKNSLPLQKFEAPRPNEIYAHLHLSADEHTAFSERWNAAAESVIAELGLEEAFLRFASLPVPLPVSIVAEIRQTNESECTKLRSFVRQLGTKSPLHFLHSLALADCFVRQDATSVSDATPNNVLERWSDLADAFGAILSWIEVRESETNKWHDATVEQQLLTVWYHSSRLLAILNERPGTEKRIVEYFKGARTAVCPDAALGGVTRSKDCSSPTNFVGVVLLFCGLGYAARANGAAAMPLTAEQWRSVHELMRVSDGINPWLFANRLSGSNRLNAFLGDAFTALPQDLASIEEQGEAFERDLLRSIEADNLKPMPWIHLYALARLGLRPTSLALASNVMSRVQLLDLANLTGQELVAWRSVAGCMLHLADERTRTAFVDQFSELATALSERHKGDETAIGFESTDDRGKQLAELIEAAVLLCRRDDMCAAYEALSKILWNIAVVWPTSRQAICKLTETVYDESRLSESASLWSTIVNLRALS